MKRIFKYVLEPTDYQIVSIPVNSKILSAESQFNDIVLYAIVDDTALVESRVEIMILGTGQESKYFDSFKFINTIKLRNGTLMFHVFCDRLEV